MKTLPYASDQPIRTKYAHARILFLIADFLDGNFGNNTEKRNQHINFIIYTTKAAKIYAIDHYIMLKVLQPDPGLIYYRQ